VPIEEEEEVVAVFISCRSFLELDMKTSVITWVKHVIINPV
jgi:hypothetical protein